MCKLCKPDLITGKFTDQQAWRSHCQAAARQYNGLHELQMTIGAI
ncbi:hypothetical protein [Halocynthiibacter styelae]|nr:hypothetical protein [Paenihalocynthiibacter styelae]